MVDINSFICREQYCKQVLHFNSTVDQTKIKLSKFVSFNNKHVFSNILIPNIILLEMADFKSHIVANLDHSFFTVKFTNIFFYRIFVIKTYNFVQQKDFS